MLKDLKRIHKILTAGRKFDPTIDASPKELPFSPSVDDKINQTDKPKTKQQKIHEEHEPQNSAPLAANEFSQAIKDNASRPAPFFKRLFSGLYLEALFLALVQMNTASAANKPDDILVDQEDKDDLGEDNLPLSSTSASFTSNLTTETSQTVVLDIGNYVDPLHQPGTQDENNEDASIQHLLDNVATHQNFSPIHFHQVGKAQTQSLSEFKKDKDLGFFKDEFELLLEDHDIVIALDDDHLIFATEEFALFGLASNHFLIVNSDLLDMFDNNTDANSWDSLSSGQEYFILTKDDVFEDDLEVITVEEEIILDESNTIVDTVTVDYFTYNDEIIGMSFRLSGNFLEEHDNFDIQALFV